MKTVMGFVVVLLFLLAGVFMMMGNKMILGILFIVLAIAFAVIVIKLRSFTKNNPNR